MFHCSVAYCSAVDDAAWAAATDLVRSLAVPTIDCLVGRAELVQFDEEVEGLDGEYEFRGGGTGLDPDRLPPG